MYGTVTVVTLATMLASPSTRTLLVVEKSSTVNTQIRWYEAVMVILPLRDSSSFTASGTEGKGKKEEDRVKAKQEFIL